MLRAAVIPLGFVVSVSANNFRRARCAEEKKNWPFDSRGFPTKITNPAEKKNSQPLYLVGAGMRRKNLYIVDVDVYLVGLGLSQNAIAKASKWASSPQEFKASETLSSYVLSNDVAGGDNEQPNAVLFCRFVRSVTKDQFIDAFREAFKDFNAEEFDAFRKSVEAGVNGNFSVNDEMIIYWLKDGELLIGKNGVIGGQLKNEAIAKRLFDVYADPRRAVSMEFYKSLEANLQIIGDKLKSKDNSVA